MIKKIIIVILEKLGFLKTIAFNWTYLKSGYLGIIRETGHKTDIGGVINRLWLINFMNFFCIRADFFFNRLCILDEFLSHNQYFGKILKLQETFKDKKNLVIIDLGSNVGWYPIFFKKKFPEKHIEFHCFEPLKDNLELCAANLKNNGIKFKINNKAVSDSDGEKTEFFIYSTSGATINKEETKILKNHIDSQKKIPLQTVTTITVDTYVRDSEIQSVDLIKIDIEGEEIAALSKSKNTILKYHPVIICAYEHFANNKQIITENMLKIRKDYDSFDDKERHMLYFFQKK